MVLNRTQQQGWKTFEITSNKERINWPDVLDTWKSPPDLSSSKYCLEGSCARPAVFSHLAMGQVNGTPCWTPNSWQLAVTWYLWMFIRNMQHPYFRETQSLWTCHGPVWCASCGHAALGFIMDSDRCCAAPACPQSISQGYIRCSQLMYVMKYGVQWHDMIWHDST